MTHIIRILLRSELHKAILLMLICHTVLWEVHIHCSSKQGHQQQHLAVSEGGLLMASGRGRRIGNRAHTADNNGTMHWQAVRCERLPPRMCTNRARGRQHCGQVCGGQAVQGHIEVRAASELRSCACRALTDRASLDKELPDELFCHLQGTQHA